MFNWDANIFYEPCDSDIIKTKIFLLETVYSIMYAIRSAMISLSRDMHSSPGDTHPVRPVEVACALSLLYGSICKHKNIPWSAGGLKALVRTFSHIISPYLAVLRY
jgi:hypothetical protein